MGNLFNTLLHNFESRKINRRRLIQTMALSAGSALAAKFIPTAVAQGGGKAFPVTTVNHLSLAVKDYAKSRDWYVEVFGMRVRWDDGKRCELVFGGSAEPNGLYIVPLAKPTDAPGVGHFAFGVPTAHFKENKTAMKAEMERRHLGNIRADGGMGWSATDPAGYNLNTWVPIRDNAMYPGAAGPCEDAESKKCKARYEAGQKISAMRRSRAARVSRRSTTATLS